MIFKFAEKHVFIFSVGTSALPVQLIVGIDSEKSCFFQGPTFCQTVLVQVSESVFLNRWLPVREYLIRLTLTLTNTEYRVFVTEFIVLTTPKESFLMSQITWNSYRPYYKYNCYAKNANPMFLTTRIDLQCNILLSMGSSFKVY